MKAELEIANQNLKQANQELEAFSRTVSHDLKSPLNGVIGFTEILMSTNASTMNDDSKKYLEIIKTSAWAMSHLIQDLLDFSRSGLVDIEEERVNLTELATESMNEITLRDPERTLKITIEPDLYAKADKKMMKVVLNNLLGNAFKYSGKKEDAEIIFGKKDYYGQELYFVNDNGAGFDMSLAHKLFLPFQRLHCPNEFKGTGIGLSTVQKIVEKHGGQIWAESEVGKGATFFFTLGN
jgi:light-regulated signal transduction histidine kinase (bacteriophytochrome)